MLESSTPAGHAPRVPRGCDPGGLVRSEGQSSTAPSALSTASTSVTHCAKWSAAAVSRCAGSISVRSAHRCCMPYRGAARWRASCTSAPWPDNFLLSGQPFQFSAPASPRGASWVGAVPAEGLHGEHGGRLGCADVRRVRLAPRRGARACPGLDAALAGRAPAVDAARPCPVHDRWHTRRVGHARRMVRRFAFVPCSRPRGGISWASSDSIH